MLENFSVFSEAGSTGMVTKTFFNKSYNTISSNRNLLGLLFHQRLQATCVSMASTAQP
jgi:hypothetical protein